jgi:hypothetical protein
VVISLPDRRTAAAPLGWVVGAAVTVVLVVVDTTRVEPGPGERPVDALAYGLMVLACTAVLAAIVTYSGDGANHRTGCD